MQTLKNNILDLSRQVKIAPLTKWFDHKLSEHIEARQFLDELTIKDLVDNELVKNLENYRVQTGKDVVVLGMSGGVDSAVTAALFKRAGWRVIGYALPIHQEPTETERGIEACVALGIEHHVIDLSTLYDETVAQLIANGDTNLGDPNDYAAKIRRGNVRARLRMVTLYNMANLHNGIVASTDNWSELAAGFWTIHGDVGDLSPIQGMNKSWEVPYIAKIIGVPESTYRATPTDGLGIDAGDEAQLGATYLEWDIMVYSIWRAIAFKASNVEITKDTLVELLQFDGDDHAVTVFNNVYGRMNKSWFKRVNPICFNNANTDNLGKIKMLDERLFHPPVMKAI